jgi:pimeloyl-ACP methyl ester carboxylesterase
MLLGHEIIGGGPEKVIVFNDWLADCSSWRPMHPYLDTRTFTYAFVDLRGYGRSLHLRGQHNEIEAASDALTLADHLGWQSFHVIGFSMTGMVVERLVLDAPHRIKSEIAVGPVSAAAVQMSKEDQAFFRSTLTDDDAVRELARRISSAKLSMEWLDHKLMLARTTRASEVVLDYLHMWTERDFSEEVSRARPATPLLVVIGEWDQEAFLEPQMRKTFMAWHPNAKLVTIRNCGHCPMQETPVYLSTLIQKFMKENARAG